MFWDALNGASVIVTSRVAGSPFAFLLMREVKGWGVSGVTFMGGELLLRLEVGFGLGKFPVSRPTSCFEEREGFLQAFAACPLSPQLKHFFMSFDRKIRYLILLCEMFM